MNVTADTAVIFPNVELGENITIENYCIIGCPSDNISDEMTVIGDNSVIRAGTVIYAGNKIGHNFKTGNNANIRECNSIGDNVSIGSLSVVEHHVKIANNVRIHSQVFIPEFSVLEEGAWLGPNVVLTNAKFPKHQNAKAELKGPYICANAKIGANATILPSVKIGQNTLIGAGSVVTKDIPSDVIALGNPARVIRSIDYW